LAQRSTRFRLILPRLVVAHPLSLRVALPIWRGRQRARAAGRQARTDTHRPRYWRRVANRDRRRGRARCATVAIIRRGCDLVDVTTEEQTSELHPHFTLVCRLPSHAHQLLPLV